jgi:hypothetical protein
MSQESNSREFEERAADSGKRIEKPENPGSASANFKGDSRTQLWATYTFSEPGTYFPVLRATSQREGDPNTPWARIENLDRVRVVVKPHVHHGWRGHHGEDR